MLAVQAKTPEALERAIPGITLSEARKIVASVHRGEPLGQPLKEVRRSAVQAVRERAFVPALEVVSEQASRVDPFVKYVLRSPSSGAQGPSCGTASEGPATLGNGLGNGNLFETVRIPLERAGRFSVCVSSQVGCALACVFCATGRMGLVRNLEAWEIVEQVRVVRARLGEGARVHGVVFQGMGEPLANLDRVLDAIGVFSNPSALAIDSRAITVCTAGIPSGIRRLAREAPKVRLAVSISSARPAVRRRLMPIDTKHPLEEVLEAAGEHARITGLAPMWAVTPLTGVNHSDEDARALADLAADFAARYGVRPRISVIPYNSMDGDGAGNGDRESDPFVRLDEVGEARFRDAMRERGVMTHKRYSGGGDVHAACGQLAGRA
jgi:23S rRNA (adenine2503-C2)-methyltransferase